MIKDKFHDFLRSFGLDVVRFPPVDFRRDEKEIFKAVRPLTMGKKQIFNVAVSFYLRRHGYLMGLQSRVSVNHTSMD